MRLRMLSWIILPACVCLGSPSDHSLPAAYISVISAVHEVIAASAGGEDAAKAKMKEKRKFLGKKYVFSEISLEPRRLGEVLYHPTPFVTGHNVAATADADGAYPGRLLITKVKDFNDGQGLWVQYSIKDVVSGEKLVRHMYCERCKQELFCGSLPASYDIRAHSGSTLM